MLRSLNLASPWSAGTYNANNTLHRRGSSNTRLIFALAKPESVMLLVLPTVVLFLTKFLPIIHISSPIIPILFFNFCCIGDNDIHNS